MPMTGKPVNIGPNTREYPIARVSRDAGFNLQWSADGRRLYWSLGPELYWRDLAETFAFFDGANTESIKAAHESEGLHIGFEARTDRPEGVVALVGARVVTMRGDEVIENATIVIEGNRIAAVGPSGQVAVPAGARTIDVAGKTIMPGIIDVHAHISAGSSGILPQTPWNFLANLAFGVTTMHDPSNNTESIFAASELIRAGEVVGPRLYSTGTILYGAESASKAVVNDYDDAVSHLRRMKKVGGFSVKSYNQPRRDVRQQFVEAARELGMLVVPEGGSTYFFNMTHVLDGHTGLEHNIPIAPLYNDALTLIAASETGYTPTLVVNYGGLNAEYYWYQESNVWENERLQRFMPPGVLEARSRRPEKAASDDYFHVEVARSAKDLLDRGTRVLIGAHGQRDGLAAHWEMWSLAQGGFTPLEVIRAATLHGAEYLGLDQDLGSIEPGKLADLVVLDANPLENIRNTESVRYVMINGRLFDGWTMDQVAPVAEARGKFWWER